MQTSHLKSLATLTILCLLPLGLKAQTTPPAAISISDDQTTTTQSLEAGQTITITSTGVLAVTSGRGISANSSGGNTIINEGEISSGDNDGILLQQGGNALTNTGTITAGTNRHGISVAGVASVPDTVTATRPAYNATTNAFATAELDTYYYDNTIVNSGTSATITGNGIGHGIIMHNSFRIQVLNTGGTITGGASGHGIYFSASSQAFVRNTGNINATAGSAIVATAGSAFTSAASEITIHNDGGTIESTGSNHAIVLRNLNIIVNSGTITGGTNSDGIQFLGAADATEVTNQATRPAHDSTQTLRDAYYFNNKVINQVEGTNTGTITGKGTNGDGINIAGARAQIFNNGGDIDAEASGQGIVFNTGSGQGFVYNSGSITSASGNAIHAVSGINEITIHNDGGTITSTSSSAIVLRSLNLVVSSGDITGGTHGIDLQGTADATEVAAQATRPAHDASDDDRDAYYFNNKVINEVVGTNTGTITGASTGHGIRIGDARAQILNNGGDIDASGTGQGILFATTGQGFVANSGTIKAASGNAVHAAGSAHEITIHNTGTLESTASNAVVLRNLNLIVNSNAITGARDGIRFIGTADATEVTAQATRPAYDASQTLRDAYYFNNKVINEVVGSDTGTITGAGTGHGINIGSARAQILNNGGNIGDSQSGNGNGINFAAGSGQSFVYNTGSINGFIGSAITAASGVNGIVIHNDGGTIESAGFYAIQLQSLNLIVNSGTINAVTGGNGINLSGTADDATLLAAAPAAAPAWDADDATRNAYYFNNIIINEVGGRITSSGGSHGISIVGERAQIFNHGDIISTGTGSAIFFGPGSGSSIVVNTGTIRSTSGWGISTHNDTDGSIVVINGGTITGGAGAIRLSTADDTLVIRTGSSITGNIDFRGGTADELIYAGAEASGRLADSVLLNLETTSESDSTSTLGAVTPEPTPTPDSGPDSTPDPNDGSGGGPSGGSGGGGGSGSAASLGNFASLFRLSDELILDLNAGIQDAIYEHNFSLNSEKTPRRNSSRRAPKKASEKPSWWTQAFGSFRAQDESDDNAKASHILGGVLLGYDSDLDIKGGDLGFFLGVALGSLSTDDDAELITQNFFGGVNFELTKDKFFYGFNFAIGITYYNSERSIEESDETVKIEGKYTGFFLSPEFILGLKTQVSRVNITPSFRVRYTFTSLEEYAEDSDAASRISAEKRNTGTIESRAQVAFPLGLSNQAWSFEPRLGFAYRTDLNKDTFGVETLATETAIDYEVEKENTLGFFGGLSIRYLKANTAFKFNVDTIYGSESLVLRAQAGFGFAF